MSALTIHSSTSSGSGKGFIDDVFLLFQGTAEELHQFHSFINASSEHLTFTLSFDAHETSYLDILIKREGSGFSTDLYRKPMYRNSLLRRDSLHPSCLRYIGIEHVKTPRGGMSRDAAKLRQSSR